MNTYTKLCKFYPKQGIDLLWIIKNDDNQKITYNTLSPHIQQVMFDCDFYEGENPELNDWKGSFVRYDELFKNITLSYKTLTNKKELK